MADIIDPKKVQESIKLVQDYYKAIDALGKEVKEGIDSSWKSIEVAFENANGDVKQFSENIRNATKDNEALRVGIAGGLGLATVSMLGLSNETSFFNEKLSIGSSTANEINQNVNKIKSSIESISKSDGLGKYFSGIGKILSQSLNLIPAMNFADTMENEFLRVQSSVGNASNLLTGVGSQKGQLIDSGLDSELTKYISVVADLRKANNLGQEEAKKYTSDIMKIPGAYRQLYTDGSGVLGQLSLTDAAIKMARGTTGEFDDAVKALTTTYNNFGKESLPSGLDMLSATYEAAQMLGMRFDDVESSITSITNRFASFGNNTQSSIDLFTNLSLALGKTGIGISQQKQIIDSITDSIYGMNQAQKSFISSQTGGSGGLMGAFQIDKMLASGDVQGVYQKIQETLQKQFGEITTLDMAASSENEAAKYERQLQFLQSGPFGSLVKDRGQAMKFLGAMSSGIGGEDIIREGAASSGALISASQINERQGGLINQFDADLEKQKALSTLGAGYLGRETIPTELKDYQSRMRKEGSASAFENIDATVVKNVVDEINNSFLGLAESAVDITRSITESASRLKSESILNNIPNQGTEVMTPTGTKTVQDMGNYKPDLSTIKIEDGTLLIKIDNNGSVSTINHEVKAALVGGM
jgi:hypothetical protein